MKSLFYLSPSRQRGTAKNSKGEYLLHDSKRLATALHSKIRLPVVWEALQVKFTKTGFIAEERTIAHEHAPLQQVLHRAIEPHNRDTRSHAGNGPGAA